MDQVLINNGYTKKLIKGNFNLIGNDTITDTTKELNLNIKVLPGLETYLNTFRNSLNKIEILKAITVYNKGILNIEVINNQLFYYI